MGVGRGYFKLNLARLESSQHFVSSSFTIQRSERLSSRRWWWRRRGRGIPIHISSSISLSLSRRPACFNLLILAESSRLKQFTGDARTRAGIRMETGNLFKSGFGTTSLLSTYLRYMIWSVGCKGLCCGCILNYFGWERERGCGLIATEVTQWN